MSEETRICASCNKKLPVGHFLKLRNDKLMDNCVDCHHSEVSYYRQMRCGKANFRSKMFILQSQTDNDGLLTAKVQVVPYKKRGNVYGCYILVTACPFCGESRKGRQHQHGGELNPDGTFNMNSLGSRVAHCGNPEHDQYELVLEEKQRHPELFR